MPDDKKEITIYSIDKKSDALNGNANILQACYDHVLTEIGSGNQNTTIRLNIDSTKFPDFNTVGIYTHRVGGPISWIKYINHSLTSPLEEASNDIHLGIIFLEHKTSLNTYAISFGMAYHFLKDLISDNFGLDILARLIDPNKPYCKKSTSQSFAGKKQGEINVYRGFQTLENNLEDFGKIFQELFVILDKDKLEQFGIHKTGKSKRKFIKGCIAKDSFKINAKTSVSGINSLLNGCEWALTQQPTTINSVKMLDKKIDKLEIEQLTEKFYSSLYDKYLEVKGQFQGEEPPFQYDLCNKEFENYLTAETAKTSFNHKSITFSHPPILIDEIFSEVSLTNKEELSDWIEKKDLVTFDGSGVEKTRDNIKKHIFAEQEVNGYQHFLVNGNWFRLDNNFISFLNTRIKDVYPEMPLSDSNFLLNWSASVSEADYISKHQNANSICIHPNLSENIEFCDLMHWTENTLYLYFIKQGFGNEIRSLSSQVLLSSERVVRELSTQPEYIKTVYADIYAKELTSMNEVDFIDLFKKKKIISVFAFYDKANPRALLKDDPSAFGSNIAKYSLVRLIGEMKKFEKIKLEIHQITS